MAMLNNQRVPKKKVVHRAAICTSSRAHPRPPSRTEGSRNDGFTRKDRDLTLKNNDFTIKHNGLSSNNWGWIIQHWGNVG